LTRFSAAIFDFGDTLFHSSDGADVLVEAGVDRARRPALGGHLAGARRVAELL
jgi:hypothetical protein